MENKNNNRSTTVVHQRGGFTIHGQVDQKTNRVGQFTVTPDSNIVHPRYADAERRVNSLIAEREKRERELRESQRMAEHKKRNQELSKKREKLVTALVIGQMLADAGK